VFNAQAESECLVPFSTDHARLDIARLLSQLNRDIELGNDNDLNLFLSLLGNVFPQQDDPAEDNTPRKEEIVFWRFLLIFSRLPLFLELEFRTFQLLTRMPAYNASAAQPA
jgi:hypothetical protein